MSGSARNGGSQSWLDWFFRDRAIGAVVIGQWPNPPLWTFGVLAGAAWLGEWAAWGMPSWLHGTLKTGSALALGWWALDEVLRGVNPWRRCLGGGVLLLGFGRYLLAS